MSVSLSQNGKRGHVLACIKRKTCGPLRLQWEIPEEGLKGYRIYRLDGRWDKDTLSRLTSEQFSETTHADKTAGSASRRYHVVAVDALGQEGFPSRPVWLEREWKRYYNPFVGEWHQ